MQTNELYLKVDQLLSGTEQQRQQWDVNRQENTFVGNGNILHHVPQGVSRYIHWLKFK